MSKSLKQRPSTLLAIDDELAAFCFDEACLYFGEQCILAMDAEEDKNPRMLRGKRENALRKMLGLQQRFADPMSLRRRS